MVLRIFVDLGNFGSYAKIARPDHWFKNVFVLPGFVLAILYQPSLLQWASVPLIIAALGATCIVASSNYTINEIIDAPFDRLHPSKKFRPAAMGHIDFPAGIVQWLILGMIGIAAGIIVNLAFGVTLVLFWLMGCVYNLPPLRFKDTPYLDVLCESANNPIRLALGWYALVPDLIPPLSLLMAFWMVGAFFMTAKRYAEYRRIGDKHLAGQYRKSLAYYDEYKLLVSIIFYTACSALFSGIFLIRYSLELIVCVPLIAGFFSYYLKITFRPDSPVQQPEKLYTERGFVLYMLVTVMFISAMLFIKVPILYDLFNVAPPSFEPLWQISE